MDIRNINYEITIDGVSPQSEQFGGIQGEHKATKLNFKLMDDLYLKLFEKISEEKVYYRFDLYDGEGSVWQSDSNKLVGNEVCFELEERHTRYGGKITIYLVITVISNSETEMELYSFPIKLRFKNRQEGINKDGDNYGSITTLAESVKRVAQEVKESGVNVKMYAANSVVAAENAKQAADCASTAVETVTNAVKETVDNYFVTDTVNVFDTFVNENRTIPDDGKGIEKDGKGFAVTTNYIDLKGYKSVTCSSTFQCIAFYDQEKSFMDREDTEIENGYSITKVPEDCVYIRPIARLSDFGNITKFDVNTAYVVLGEYTGGYIPYKPQKLKNEMLDMEYISGEIAKEVASEIEQGCDKLEQDLGKKINGIEKCFTPDSINLFNPDALVRGKSISDIEGTKGQEVKQVSYGLGEYIDLRYVDKLTLSSSFEYIAFFNEDGSYSSRPKLTLGNVNTIDVSAYAFARPIVKLEQYDSDIASGQNQYIVEGEYTGEYIPYKQKLLKTEHLDIEGISKKINTLNKTIIAFGDSIVVGLGNQVNVNGYNKAKGYVELYAEKRGCSVVREINPNNGNQQAIAKSGATITNKVSDGRSWIYDQITNNLTKQADLCVIGGMTNDCEYFKNGTLDVGTISNDYSTFDLTTFYGALEQILLTCKETWKNVVFVLPHNMSSRTATAQKTLRDIVLEVCEKWSVEVVDLYANCGLNTNIPFMKNDYTSNPEGIHDGTHPNGEGYEKFYLPQVTPVFDKYLKD